MSKLHKVRKAIKQQILGIEGDDKSAIFLRAGLHLALMIVDEQIEAEAKPVYERPSLETAKICGDPVALYEVAYGDPCLLPKGHGGEHEPVDCLVASLG